MGCRLNIGIFLATAVYLARKYLNAGKIALFSEWNYLDGEYSLVVVIQRHRAELSLCIKTGSPLVHRYLLDQ
jgi:hypothetical protein